jgi:hypothetical protein
MIIVYAAVSKLIVVSSYVSKAVIPCGFDTDSPAMEELDCDDALLQLVGLLKPVHTVHAEYNSRSWNLIQRSTVISILA